MANNISTDQLNVSDPLHNASWLSKNVSSIAGLVVLVNFFVYSFIATFGFGLVVNENIFNVVFIGISNVTTGYVTYLWGASKTQKDALKAKLLTTGTVSNDIDSNNTVTTTNYNTDQQVLSCDVIKLIKADIAAGVPNADISIKYNIDMNIITSIIDGTKYSECE